MTHSSVPRSFVLLTCFLLVSNSCRGASRSSQEDLCARALATQRDTHTVVVLFWASWSAPDKLLIPLLEEGVKERPSVALRKVDVDESRSIALACNVRSIPDVRVLRNGSVTSGFIGAVPKGQVDHFLDSLTRQGPEP